MTTPRELTTMDELNQAITDSSSRPVVIFKHSPTCGTSAMAHEEILDLMAGEAVPADVHLVQVRSHRSLSDAIAARLGIRHESPQALILRDGRVVWSASHFRVTAEAILQKLRDLAVPPQPPAATTIG